jgi:hypothetical protein
MPEPITGAEARDLKDSIKELTAEFKNFRTEAGLTYVRQDNHSRDLQLLTEAHNKDVQLITQGQRDTTSMVLARMDAADRAVALAHEVLMKAIGDEGLGGRVKTLEDGNDWLRKVIYASIIVAVLAAVGVGSAASNGLIR